MRANLAVTVSALLLFGGAAAPAWADGPLAQLDLTGTAAHPPASGPAGPLAASPASPGAPAAAATAAPAVDPATADAAAGSAPAALAPEPILRHEPVGWVRAGEPLEVLAHWEKAPMTAVEVLLHYRRLGQAEFRTLAFGLRNETTLEATVPAAELRAGTLEYYLSSRAGGSTVGLEHLHFGSPQWPHAVAITVEDSERTQRALLAQHLGNHSQFRLSGMYVDRGIRTVASSDLANKFDMRDYYYRLEGDYTYRILASVHSIRIGGGVLRGDTFTFAQPRPVHVANVGLTYGFAEVRFRLARLVRLDARATLGAGPDHFDGGAGGQILIGLDPGTHFAVGVDGVSSVGIRAWVRLAWTTVPRVPMSFTLEASNLPIGQDVGGLMYLTAGYRFNRYASFDAHIGYAHRDKAVGGPISGLTLKFEF